MAKIAMKFGGTSVADLDRIRNVAQLVKKEVERGHQVAVVVSAMAGETNKLVKFINDLDQHYDPKEYDAVVAAGEQVTSGLLAIALGSIGVPARSFLGWQMPMKTSNMHASARIEDLPPENLNACLESGTVAVVAGFQGVAEGERISTLGRGGSDTSAVAVAAAIKAERCDIYTDVDGVYTTDPRITKKAQRMEKIAFEEMLEMASLGAKVLQTRSVEIAMQHRVPVRVLSTFDPDAGGTLLCDEEDIVEKKPVTGIAYSRDEAKISLMKIPDHPGIAAAIFGPLAHAGINVDMIVQNISDDGKRTDLTFTCPRTELARAIKVLEDAAETIGYREITSDANVAKISIIGIGMRTHPGVAQTMFRTLSEKGINISVISTSEIKVSVLIAEEYVELAVRALHSAYDLDAA
ncbi:aspartate kinase [Rhizomicrobium palustre]|uniref:Aspartokinase n=1 Tax=Rhizomicrobium palustre TaxID=189966 RepID=A0A846N4N3_9PROT|nr:aspartate kinase [Rhizomicrobium palustre]NIK90000.1 aspartate kinase [Rhizomicrobium palustre]